MNLFVQTLILLLAAAVSAAAPVPREPHYTIDVSRGRLLEDLLKTGIPLKSSDQNQVWSHYSIENAFILFRFPNGLEFEHYVESLSIVVEDSRILSGHTNGMIMPLEEAYGIVSKAENAAGISPERLEGWIAEARNEVPANGFHTYMNGIKSADGMFSLNDSIHNSINAIYRATIDLDFCFVGDSMAPENTVYKRISLDPVQFYSREEAWEGAEEEFKAAQAAMKAAESARAAAEDPAKQTSVRPPATFAPLWPWLACGFLLLLLLLMAFKQYRNRGRRSH